MCGISQASPRFIEQPQPLWFVQYQQPKSVGWLKKFRVNLRVNIAKKPPTFLGRVNQAFNERNEFHFFRLYAGFAVTFPGQSIIGVSSNKSTSHTSKTEPDKLWQADPYGLIHDLADVIHYSIVVLIAAFVGFFASRARSQN
jgi:hypothetical protein